MMAMAKWAAAVAVAGACACAHGQEEGRSHGQEAGGEAFAAAKALWDSAEGRMESAKARGRAACEAILPRQGEALRAAGIEGKEALAGMRVEAFGRVGPAGDLFELSDAWGEGADADRAGGRVELRLRTASSRGMLGLGGWERHVGWRGEEDRAETEQAFDAGWAAVQKLAKDWGEGHVAKRLGMRGYEISIPPAGLAKAQAGWSLLRSAAIDFGESWRSEEEEREAASAQQREAVEQAKAIYPLTWQERLWPKAARRDGGYFQGVGCESEFRRRQSEAVQALLRAF